MDTNELPHFNVEQIIDEGGKTNFEYKQCIPLMSYTIACLFSNKILISHNLLTDNEQLIYFPRIWG